MDYKKFGFFNTGKKDLGWEECEIDYKKYLEEIELKDKEGKNPDKEVISIPSPFARIHLIDQAFEYLYKELRDHGKIEDRQNIYCKLVSYVLDFAEIIYNYDNFKDHIEVKKINLSELFNSNKVARHKEIQHALNLYLKQDEDAFFFNLWKENVFVFIYWENGKKKLLGTTAPKVLYLPAPDKFLPKIPGKDYFSNKYKLLEDRSEHFKAYFISLINELENIYQKEFSNLINYVKETKEKKEIPDSNIDYNKSLEELKTKHGEEVFIGKKPDYFIYRYLRITPSQIQDLSDFIIEIPENKLELLKNKYDITSKPMVLAKTKSKKILSKKYIQTNITEGILDVVPYKEEQDPKDRILPNENIRYPYIVVNDFLEEYILYIDDKINKDFWFMTEEQQNYFFPIKLDYFNYFSLEDLKDRLKIKKDKTIKVELDVPIKEDKISFERSYYCNREPLQKAEVSKELNEGGSIKIDLDIYISPPIKLNNDNDNIYHILIKENKNNPIEIVNIHFYKEEERNKELLEVKSTNFIKSDSDKYRIRTYLIENDRFDIIHFQYKLKKEFLSEEKNGGELYSAILIPNFSSTQIGAKKYVFAIDFGTTNTYVSVLNENQIMDFEVKEEDLQIGYLRNSLTRIKKEEILHYYWMPITFGDKENFKFPTRTAIAYPSKKDFQEISLLNALLHTNIAFFYEKYPPPADLKVETRLKWGSKDQTKKELVKNYFEQLFFMIRNEVILNKGDLFNTEILWFYPYSMSSHQRDNLNSDLKNLLKKYFNTENKIKSLTESIAPFYYFNKTKGVTAQDNPAVVIDIGGKTTDILIFLNNEPQIAASFRFASESIFGGGYNYSAENNGFILFFQEEMKKLFQNCNFKRFVDIQEDLIKNNLAMDVIEFWFSLENYEEFRKKTQFSFLDKLRDAEDLKIIFLLFYSSLFYFVDMFASIFLNGERIRTFCFSGLGSKTLQVLSPDNKKIKEFIKKLLDLDDIELYIEEKNPKEVTCKGGLNIIKDNRYEELLEKENDFYKVIVGYKEEKAQKLPTYNELKKNPNLYKDKVVKEIEKMIEKLKKVNKDFNFKDKFGISNFNDEFIKEFKKKLKEHFKDGLDERINDLDKEEKNKEISETLFFYPIVGSLADLAHYIATRGSK
jgi:hypothetical protein